MTIMIRRNSKSSRDSPHGPDKAGSRSSTLATPTRSPSSFDRTVVPNEGTTPLQSGRQLLVMQDSQGRSEGFFDNIFSDECLPERDMDVADCKIESANRRKKTAMLALLCLLCLLCITVLLVAAWWYLRDPDTKPVLRFRDEKGAYKFKVVQLADLHIGEDKQKDGRTWKLVDKIIEVERPDLVVLSGDQISANFSRERAAEEYQSIGRHLTKHRTPWAMIFGSSDDMGYTDPVSNITFPAYYKREELLAVDQSFRYSLTERGPESIFGITNYILDIHIDNDVAANLYFYDSGGGSLPEQLVQNQINWFYHSYHLYPSIAFQYHSPLELLHSDKCIGQFGEDFKPLKMDPGIVNAMSESSRVSLLSVGRNHGNDYCCPFTQDMQVCFGRHTGYGGYGEWDRGARVFELTITDPTSHEMDWNSWVRLESGIVADTVSRVQMLSRLGLST